MECPHCGKHIVLEPKSSWDMYELNMLRCTFSVPKLSISYKVTKNESLYLAAMLTACGRIVSRAHLLETAAGWAPEHKIARDKTVDVILCKLRRRMNPWGFLIQSEWGRGYRLITETELPTAERNYTFKRASR